MELCVVIISVVACGAELWMFNPTESSVPQPTPSPPACSELPRACYRNRVHCARRAACVWVMAQGCSYSWPACVNSVCCALACHRASRDKLEAVHSPACTQFYLHNKQVSNQNGSSNLGQRVFKASNSLTENFLTCDSVLLVWFTD